MIYLSQIAEGKQVTRLVPMPKFVKSFDVIVCGLGTAGSLAALFSAENGLYVLGIESFTCVGGTHTVGGVPHHYFGCPGGRYEKLDAEISDLAKSHTCTQAESRILLTEQKLCENGAELLYEAYVCGVYLEDNTVIGVRVAANGVFLDYGARLVIDSTAEAYVAVMSGCKAELGRSEDGQMQPYSLVSLMYDGEKYGYTNVDYGRVNQFDSADLSDAVIFSRSYKMHEGHGKKELIAQMPMLGIREGRRIIADETVRLKDLFEDRQTETPMFYSYADLDKHGWDIAFDGEVMGDFAIGANLGAYNVTVAVPYKAMLPKDLDGILVACRSLGVDRDISSCVRMLPDMKKMAEAAAEWATLAIKQGKKLRDVPYEQLKERLTRSGCLKDSDNKGYRVDYKKKTKPAEEVCWITDPSRLCERLCTETPGQGIWSAKRIGKSAVPSLLECLNSSDENLRKHSAFALAILQNTEGCKVLRNMVTERDPLMLNDCRKHNNLRGCMAIYWLGRLCDREIVKELTDLITNPREIERSVYHKDGMQTTRYEVADFEDVYFQFVSQAVMALVRIGNAHADLRSVIEKAFYDAFSTDDYYLRITKRPKESSEGNMVQNLKNIAFSAVKRWKE